MLCFTFGYLCVRYFQDKTVLVLERRPRANFRKAGANTLDSRSEKDVPGKTEATEKITISDDIVTF